MARSKASQSKGTFCLTPTAETIMHALSHCHTGPDMGVVVGPPGIGKTTTLQHYAAETPCVYVATMSPAERKSNHMLRTVGAACGIWSEHPSPYELNRRLKGELARQYGRLSLLIIDEAQHLDTTSLETLRCIHDQAGCGLVFVGNEHITTQVKGAQRALFAQFLSRIGMDLRLEQSPDEDIEAFCDHNRVRGDRARAILAKIGAKAGGLRTVGKITNLAREKSGEGKPIELPHVQAAMEFLGLS